MIHAAEDDYLRSTNRTMILTATYAGLRQGELLAEADVAVAKAGDPAGQHPAGDREDLRGVECHPASADGAEVVAGRGGGTLRAQTTATNVHIRETARPATR